jgi:adenine nucleotide transporter 17
MLQIDTAAMPAFVHAIGGSLGSASALLLLYPLERAKIELQYRAGGHEPLPSKEISLEHADEAPIPGDSAFSTSLEGEGGTWNYVMTEEQPLMSSESSPSASTGVEKPPTTKRGDLLHCLNELRQRNELYRGVGPIVSTLAVSNFVFFYVTQWMKQFWKAESSHARLLVSLFCAGTCNVLVTNPLWVTNLRIMTSRDDTKQLWTELRNIYKEEGWKPLWAGTGSSILLVSNPVIQFFIYDHLRHSHQKPWRAFWTGAASKAIATLLTYPLQLTQAVMRLHRQKYSSLMDCFIQLYKKEGLPGWYVGMRAKMLQTVLTGTLY